MNAEHEAATDDRVHPFSRMRRLVALIRDGDPDYVAALRTRWAELPESARTPGQVLGRRGVGCEGTHGVFPQCNLTCTPCYHSADANRVRTDGPHTLRQLRDQFTLLKRRRGPRSHAQLIGGEVSLLPAGAHAEALELMREFGREPMSFTHGDFDYDYLRELALTPSGRRQFRRVSFAAHFDLHMYGRRGIPRPPDEASLDPYRRQFTAMFRRLRRDHGVRSFLAHNMTVTAANVNQIAGVIAANRDTGFRMFSFQPAAYVGDDRRWREGYRSITPDQVWSQVEQGAGASLDYHLFQHGDLRCNRVAYGFFVGPRWYPWLDANDPRDVRLRDDFLTSFGHISFTGPSALLVAAQCGASLLRDPGAGLRAAAWLARLPGRIGWGNLARHRKLVPVTFVMHQFIDAAQVAPAWAALQRGETLADPELRGVQERLSACHYAMAHPEDGTLVPACVQHSLLDGQENASLAVLLPMPQMPKRTNATVASVPEETPVVVLGATPASMLEKAGTQGV